METRRVVEVLHDRGEAVKPRWLLGSGFVVRTDVVLTAAHNLGEDGEEPGQHGTVVRGLDGVERSASLIVRSSSLDLALLSVSDLTVDAVKVGRIDRDRIGVVRNVMAVGFPNYKYSESRPSSSSRQPAQPVGTIPTAEGATSGDLTIKVEAGEPAPAVAGASPWEGLSGAGVFVGEHLLGIVIEHHLAEGLGALRLVPVDRILGVVGYEGTMFKALLGISDDLEIVGDSELAGNEYDPVLASIVKDLEEVMSLGQLGLLTPNEVSALKITAYKEAKGWR